MKRILRLMLSVLLLFCSLNLFTGCMFYGLEEYFQYETLKIESEREGGPTFISYKGNRYFYSEEIEYATPGRPERGPYMGLYMEEMVDYPDKYGNYYDKKQWVGKVYNGTIFLPFSRVYVSAFDKEANVLFVEQSSMWSFGGFYVKEGIDLPDIYTSSIENIIISVGDRDGPHGLMNESICVPTLTPNTTYYDIVDQSSRAQIDTKRLEVVFHGYLGIKGFEYLKVQYLAIFEVENEICIAESQVGLVDVIDYYKVKSEYQEVFRNAMNELNAM